MALRDRTRFVGRAAELALVDQLLVDDPPASVVLVHGPGGIGKSALLREIGRRGHQAGWTVVHVEGRDLPPLPDALDDAAGVARRAERPLLLVDSYEHMAALGGHLRRVVLPVLPDRAVVVIAGRRAPEPEWFSGGWENVTRQVELGPLSAADALTLLAAHGLRDQRRAAALAPWASGSPLALTFVARAANDTGWQPADQPEPPRELLDLLVRRLLEEEYDSSRRTILWIACIARVTTARLIRDVLAGTGSDVDAAEAMRWLASRSFAEPLGDGVTLHELVRRVLRSDLRLRDPEGERDLRRRIVDSLHAAAVAGRTLLTVDLAELLDSPDLRALYGWEGAVRNRLDRVRPGDVAQIEAHMVAMDAIEWWEPTRLLFEQTPGLVTIARDAAGTLCGYGITVTPASAPPVARADPVFGPWLEHAAEVAPDGNVLLVRDSIDFTRDPTSRIQAMLNVSALLRSGLTNPRWVYLPIDPQRSDIVAFSAVLGARHVPELDPDTERLQCHLLDAGPGGVLGLQRDVLYLELGLPPPGAGAGAVATGAAGPGTTAPVVRDVDPKDVRDALRNLRLPVALADSPLATGVGVDERAASVRRLLEDAVEHAFGDTDDEQLLRRVLVRGYVEGGPSHEHSARELHLSRAAYFRRLRRASDRVAEYLAGGSARPT